MVSPYVNAGVSFPTDLLKKVDAARGDIPRSKFIVRILEKALSKSKTNKEAHE
jgi:metal-responsive CopG/Arc/MetJ family transcriptional regulator